MNKLSFHRILFVAVVYILTSYMDASNDLEYHLQYFSKNNLHFLEPDNPLWYPRIQIKNVSINLFWKTLSCGH